MLGYALTISLLSVATISFAAAPPSVPNTHPQGEERSPNDREFFAPIQTPASLAEVVKPTKQVKPIDSALAIYDWMLHFQRPLGLAKGTWLAMR